MHRSASHTAPARSLGAAEAELARRRVSETYHGPLTRPRVTARERYHKLLGPGFTGPLSVMNVTCLPIVVHESSNRPKPRSLTVLSFQSPYDPARDAHPEPTPSPRPRHPPFAQPGTRRPGVAGPDRPLFTYVVHPNPANAPGTTGPNRRAPIPAGPPAAGPPPAGLGTTGPARAVRSGLRGRPGRGKQVQHRRPVRPRVLSRSTSSWPAPHPRPLRRAGPGPPVVPPTSAGHAARPTSRRPIAWPMPPGRAWHPIRCQPSAGLGPRLRSPRSRPPRPRTPRSPTPPCRVTG